MHMYMWVYVFSVPFAADIKRRDDRIYACNARAVRKLLSSADFINDLEGLME